MRTIYEIICGIIFVLLNVTLVSVVYYYNRHPIKKYGNKKLTPEELSKVIAEEIGNQPEFYTYEKKDNGKYRVYALSLTDKLTYEEREFDYPVDFNGVTVKPLTESDFKFEHTDNGFKIPGIKLSFDCPMDYKWDKKSMKCVEKSICEEYNNSVKPLYDRYYSEIDNPSITPVTTLTGKIPHPRLYIQCSSYEQKPVIKACSKENEKFDIQGFVTGSENLSIKPCKIYDVCQDYFDGTRHAYRINNDFSEALKVNEYYLCNHLKSQKKICQSGYECNERSTHNNDICKPINYCRPNIDYYFTINPNSYSYCLSNKRQEVCCGENGIIKLSDNSYQCKTDNFVYYLDPQTDVSNGFVYASKIYKGLQKSRISLVSFDDWFREKFSSEPFTLVSLPKTSTNYNKKDEIFKFEAGGKRDYYEDDKDMELPTKFYYATDGEEKWTPFPNNEKLSELMQTVIAPSKIFHLSASNAMYAVASKIKTENLYEYCQNFKRENSDLYYEVDLLPEDYGIPQTSKFWIIHNGNVYNYIYNKDSSTKETKQLGSSKNYYSFIGPMMTEPIPKISDSIIGEAFRETEGIYYALCSKLENNYFTCNDKIVYHKNLSVLLDEHNNKVDPNISSKLSLDLNNLIKDGILPSYFPIDEFSWDKLYVGKYYYNKENHELIVWHNHLLVLKLMDVVYETLNKIKGLIVDDKGQFKFPNYPTNVVDIAYNSIDAKNEMYKNKKYLTELSTTFNYYDHNYNGQVVHWLSYIPISQEIFDKFEKIEKGSPPLEPKFSILSYLTISYPKLKESTIMETLINILLLKPFTLTID